MKLYEISEKYSVVESLFEQGDIDEDTLRDTLEAIDGELTEKADNIACLIKDKRMNVVAINSEIKRLKDRADREEKSADHLKEYLSRELQKAGKMSLTTPRNSIGFRKSEALEIADTEQFLASYPKYGRVKTSTSVDKESVKEAIKSGMEFEGAVLAERKNIQIG